MKKRKGIILIICAGFFFALMTFFVRISGDLPTMQKAFFRNAIAAVFVSFTLAKSKDKFKIKKTSWTGLLMRSACGSAGLICNFYAIDRLNIADANMLNKLSPFFAIIASYFILKEKTNLREWITVIVAFTGSLFIIKPSFEITSLYALAGLLGGLGAGVAYTYVRKLGKQGECGEIIILCFSVFSCLVTLPFMIMNYVPMTGMQFLILVCAGLAATGGQFCITKAYTYAPAKDISVFDYTQVIFATILGYLFLDQIPDALSFIGYAIILFCAIYKWFCTQKEDKQS